MKVYLYQDSEYKTVITHRKPKEGYRFLYALEYDEERKSRKRDVMFSELVHAEIAATGVAGTLRNRRKEIEAGTIIKH